MSHDYIFVKRWETKKGSTGETAYVLPNYDATADAETLIHQSTTALHPSQVDVSKMKKKRCVDGDCVYGVT